MAQAAQTGRSKMQTGVVYVVLTQKSIFAVVGVRCVFKIVKTPVMSFACNRLFKQFQEFTQQCHEFERKKTEI